jgi:tryptophanyl-tRNA synthetase
VDCKTILADHLIEYFRPYRERRAELSQEPGLVERVLAEGLERVRPVARETLEAVREAMHYA